MTRKRKKRPEPDEALDSVASLFEIVPETPSPSVFKTVAETQEDLPPLELPSTDDVYRLTHSVKDTHSSVICKLSRVCRLPELQIELARVAVVMKQVQLEGWHLANLHFLRCLKNKEDVPDPDQMFFYRCCSAVLGEPKSFVHDATAPKYPSFHRTCLQYWTGRESVVAYSAESLVNAGSMLNEMAKLTEINSKNMLALHFRRRLHQYIRFRYAPKGKLEMKYTDAMRLVDSCYRVKTVPVLGENQQPTGRTTPVWAEWDDTSDPVEKELRKWLKHVPWQFHIRANSGHFVQKVADMLSYMEGFVKKHPSQKGARVYSLLPVASSYQAAYVKINATTLHGIFARLVKQHPSVEAYLKDELDIVPTKKITSNTQRPFTKKTFQTYRSEILRQVFDVAQFETVNRKFADELKTNGYAASVTMIRPLTTTTAVVVEKTTPKKQKKNDGTSAAQTPKKSRVKTPQELAEGDSFAKELFKLGPGYSPDVLIGIDPGMRSLVTAVTVGRLHRRRRKRGRRFRRQRTASRARRLKKVTEITTREYRHLARMNDFRRWNEDLKKREPWYAGVVHAMSSFKTSSFDLYFERLQFFWQHLRFLLAFSAEQGFLRWRFTQDRAKMAAIDALAKRLVPIPSKQVCIAYGDWSRRDGIKGHATGPVKGFVEALKKRATVLPMDEFRTSITCSCCHKRLKQTRLFTKVKRKDGEVDIRTKARPSKKEAKEIEEMKKFRKPMASQKIVLKCTRNVLRCTNSGCKANFWNRDVNAAMNMLEQLRSGLKRKHGASRVRAFRRVQLFLKTKTTWVESFAAQALREGVATHIHIFRAQKTSRTFSVPLIIEKFFKTRKSRFKVLNCRLKRLSLLILLFKLGVCLALAEHKKRDDLTRSEYELSARRAYEAVLIDDLLHIRMRGNGH
jgi:hypothetical protein